MPTLARPVPLLDVLLLRKGVGAAEARRESCVHCHRTPLVGERVHLYEAASETRLVCDLCRGRRREPPTRTRLVHPQGADGLVRVTRAPLRGAA